MNEAEAEDEEDKAGAVQFAISETFKEEIDEWESEKKPNGVSFFLGTTGDVIQGLGATENEIFMRSDKINKIFQDHPEMTTNEIKKTPEILEDPILVLASKRSGKNGNSRVVVLGSLKATNGEPVLAILDLLPQEGKIVFDDLQKVSSAYTKPNKVGNLIAKSEIMYADKKRTMPLLRSAGLAIASQQLLQHGSLGSITYSGKSVKLQGVPFYGILGGGRGGRGRAVQYAISNTFEENCKKIEEGDLSRGENPFIQIAEQTPSILIDYAGANNLPLIISYESLYLAVRKEGKIVGHYHDLGEKVMTQIARELNKPEMIILAENGRINEIVKIRDKIGNKILVSVEFDAVKDFGGKNNKFNLVITVFGAKNNYLNNVINNPKNAIVYKKNADDTVQVNPRLNKLPSTINTVPSGSTDSIRNFENKSNTKKSETSDVPLENRVSGDELLDAQDLIDTVKAAGAVVDAKGFVTVYHRTSGAVAEKIQNTGRMTAKEDGLFFSTREDGQNAGYGDSVLKLTIPAEKLVLDDIFDDEAHLRLPLDGGRKSADVSKYLAGDAATDTEEPTRQYSISKTLEDDLRAVKVGTFDDVNKEVYLGETSNFMTKVIGAKAMALYASPTKAYANMVSGEEARNAGRYDPKLKYHKMGIDGYMEAMQESEAPIAAFADTPDADGNKRLNRVVLVTEMKKDGAPVVVIEEVDDVARSGERRIRANKTVTLYPRGRVANDIVQAANEGRLLYLDKKRSQTLTAGRPGAKSPVAIQEVDFTSSIRNFWANVNWEKSGETEMMFGDDGGNGAMRAAMDAAKKKKAAQSGGG